MEKRTEGGCEKKGEGKWTDGDENEQQKVKDEVQEMEKHQEGDIKREE